MTQGNELVLTVDVVEYFGRVTIKPQCELSRKFAKLLRQNTLTEEDVAMIKELGFVVKTKEKVL